MANLAEQYGFRDDLVDELINDLVGPAEGPGEVITDLPLDRYVSGVLWPADDLLQEAAEPDSGEPEENDAGENPISQALMRYPTSMGITFSVDLARATSVQIAVDAAKYVPSGTGNTSESVDAERSSRRQRTRRPDSWVREQQVVDPIDWDVATPGAKKVDVVPGLQLYVYSRTPKDGRVAVSVALRNMQVTPKGELRDGFAWFQVGLEVRSVERAIVDRSSYGVLSADADLRSAALLYRNARVFAIGHGCAATWDRDGAAAHVGRVVSTFIPRQEVSRAKPGSVGADIDLRMSFLSGATDGELFENLSRLVSEYRDWIDRLSLSVQNGETDVEEGLKAVVDEHVERARNAARRIQDGIDLIAADPDVGRAFRLANAAMQMQRARQDWVRGGATGAVGDGAAQSWRPFQIAYILLNLPGLADADHKVREIADLLWFPTGGGKTEAYLGLTAFTVFFNALSGVQPPTAGELFAHGQRLTGAKPHRYAAAGIARTFQTPRVFAGLSVAANIDFGLQFAGRARTASWLLKDEASILNLIGLSAQSALPAGACGSPGAISTAMCFRARRRRILRPSPGWSGRAKTFPPSSITACSRAGCWRI